jgi:chromosome segregation ATPase
MKPLSHDPPRAQALIPLLRSITRELEERRAEIERLEAHRDRTEADVPVDQDLLRSLAAEIAVHRRELRAAESELERLGCSVVGTTPLTIRIPTGSRRGSRSLIWQPST